MDYPLDTLGGEGALGGVTENKSEALEDGWAEPPMELTADDLRDAKWLSLSPVPASGGATSLVDAITAQVGTESGRGRKTGRRKAGREKLRRAVGAIVGGLLQRWARGRPAPVFRSRKPADFSGGLVGARQYLTAMDALVSLGLVRQSEGIRYGLGCSWNEGDAELFSGKAPRYWPAVSLLSLAERHGITPATIRADFVNAYPTAPPKVPQPVQMNALERRKRGDRLPVPISPEHPMATRIRAQVDRANQWTAEHAVQGCLPPRFKRVYTSSWLLGGRWYAVGSDGNYQRMSEAERLAITINGEAVVEADVSASHLSIMHGLLGLPLPEGDPYAVAEVPREVVKAWLTATLGKGSPVRRWPEKIKKERPDIAGFPGEEANRAIVGLYAFLRDPAGAVAGAAKLTGLANLGRLQKLLTHRLMNIEAVALTRAMDVMRGQGILALPLHDSLIVPQSAAPHVTEALVAAFSVIAKVRVRVKLVGSWDSSRMTLEGAPAAVGVDGYLTPGNPQSGL